MAGSSSSVSESPQQAAVVIPQRLPRIAARRSASTHEEHAAQVRPRFDDTKPKTTGPAIPRGKASLQKIKRKVAEHEGGIAKGGTPSKDKNRHKEPDSDVIESWEQLPAKLLAKIVPRIDNKAIENARNVCRTWRLNIDLFVVLRESFTGDVLNTSVWKTDKLNIKVFKVDRPMRGYFRREAMKLLKFNQWSSLTTKQLLPAGTIISYMVRFPVSWGNETKFTVTGGAILKQSNLNYTPIELKPQDNSSFIWQRWDGNFHGLAYSVVRPGERWYSIVQAVSDGLITYAEGQRMFKLPCVVPQEGIKGALLLQHLDVGSAVCMDIANLFIIKL